MKHILRTFAGLDKQTDYVKRFLYRNNMYAAIYMAFIVVVLEVWMILSLLTSFFEKAAAGTPRDGFWLLQHGGWYVVLLGVALAVLVYAIRYVRGKTKNDTVGKVLLLVFSVACLAFGIYYGNNSYAHGEQVLTFVTMTLFVFGLLVWRPVPVFLSSALVFGGFYLLIDSSAPATYGTQVNLFTLWISTFVVALSAYHQRVSEGGKSQKIEEANARLTYIATHDELTGIPNMHTFRGTVNTLLQDESEAEAINALDETVLYFDIENFRAYNDKFGFVAGDELLRRVAEGLQEIFANELVARISDDHFVALCEKANVDHHVQAAQDLVHGLRNGVRMFLKTGSYDLTPDDKGTDASAICDKARIACTATKKKSDLHFLVYDTGLDKEVHRRQHVINSIKQAVREGWIKVYYQPVVRCGDGTGELCGYEALARWDDPIYGLLPPFAFIETLEEYREIDKLDRCIIEQVCRDLRAELDAGANVVPVSLNFSRLDFELYDVPAFLAEMCQKYNVPSSLLDVEITESALTEQLLELQDNMGRLRKDRFSLWLDDFGSGYSSLNVLKDFQFNVLKIDMAFLRGFPENKKSGPILQAIVALAKELGMVTLCEGVETREQFDFLHSIGCDRAQGYYFGRPEPQKLVPHL